MGFACIPTQNIEKEVPISKILDSSTSKSMSSTSVKSSKTYKTSTTTTTLPPLSCPSTDWILFDRGTYSWCIYLYWFPSPVYGNSALPYCKTLNSASVVSGFQNRAEVNSILSVANPKGSWLQIFIGAYRTSACMNSHLTSTCNQLTTFEWTDKHTTGTDGFVWEPNQPDNTGLIQRYVILWTGRNFMDDTGGMGNGAICGIQAKYF
ncbi:unnamed protein product [Caenorhabditis angaria]|uniref:C-type lectin domain-containing protein n=1 Tax=Caenorhabditis angaria TaxID=860376 RepID=A0A9P1IM14_9PELO|nr:unnamed protein product [Caenorhabditis angaria]